LPYDEQQQQQQSKQVRAPVCSDVTANYLAASSDALRYLINEIVRQRT